MGIKLQRILLWIAVGTAALVSWSADASAGQDLTTHDAAEGNDFGSMFGLSSYLNHPRHQNQTSMTEPIEPMVARVW